MTGSVAPDRSPAGGGADSVHDVYDDLWSVGQLARWAAEQTALQPRPPSHLFELVADLDLGPAAAILDVGCGQGDHACELARLFGARVVAIDPVASSLQSASERVRLKGLGGKVEVRRGRIERIPSLDGEFDLVWCRGVVVHLHALVPAFQECWRALVPGGSMMLQTGFATARLEPQEAELLRRRLGFVEASMHRPNVEAALAEAGFSPMRSESYGSEFSEFYEIQEGRCAHHLAGIARLQRAEETVVDRFGRAAYETALGMYHWQIYQMLGKISYHAYLLVKSP